eukprot:TRINITY_DN5553_c0_g1_i2.p1 TRINITY_DN5553_c0_g1~~TRINITY_DN5553_c0_g1_i2.p1  ORF type:complete len:108 (-),score=1.11 TRINITY_DN5553_c0_g1_i2:394-717(-)
MVETLCGFWRCKHVAGDVKMSLTSISRRAGVQLERKMNKNVLLGDGLENSMGVGGDMFSVNHTPAYGGGMIRKLSSMNHRRRSNTSRTSTDMDAVVEADFSQESPPH